MGKQLQDTQPFAAVQRIRKTMGNIFHEVMTSAYVSALKSHTFRFL